MSAPTSPAPAADPPPPVSPPAVPAIAGGPVLAVAGVVAAVHLVAASFRGRWFDEALMVAIGRHHLDWGSADQPPVAPLLAGLVDRVAPGSSLALAVPAVLATAGAVVLAALVARELGGDARAQTLTALAQATGLVAALCGHWLTPYALEPVGWLAIAWLLVRWIRVRDDRLLLVLGVVLGIAAETKFQVLLLATVLLVAVAVLGPRALLGRVRLWIGAGLAGLVAAPTLIWQAEHGWPQLAMGPVVTSEAEFLYGGRVGVALLMVLAAGVLGTALGGYGLVRLLRAPDLRFLAMTTIVLFVLFALTPGRPYYLAGLYGVLAAAGAVGLQRRREAGRTRWRWVAWPATVLSVALAAAVLRLSVPMASPDVADAVVTATAREFHALPAAQRERTVLMGESYIYAAYLDSADPGLGLPPAASPNRSYGWFGTPAPGQDTVLHVGDPDALRPWFAEVREVGRIDPGPAQGVSAGDTATRVWLLTGQRAPWPVIWPAVRTLTVS